MKIGITCSYPSRPTSAKNQANLQHYIDALADAGAEGIPLWRPRVDDESKIAARAAKLAAQLDGLIVSGGKDLDPQSYGAATLPDANIRLVHPLRPRLETLLISAMRRQKKPLLGICYGSQLFNIMSGGTLIQDIPLQKPNSLEHGDSRHTVRLAPGSFLQEIIGLDEFEVTSYHHQAIDCIAPGCSVAARAADGIIEAIELDRDSFWLGVQWHPERDRHCTATKNLFAAFVSACSAAAAAPAAATAVATSTPA